MGFRASLVVIIKTTYQVRSEQNRPCRIKWQTTAHYDPDCLSQFYRRHSVIVPGPGEFRYAGRTPLEA